ncbi:MAG: carbohydrate ABC transporter permease [Anaerolineales bacterium]|nr:carbohydrate ABC transporter permease [Anaerolineales bacterium]
MTKVLSTNVQEKSSAREKAVSRTVSPNWRKNLNGFTITAFTLAILVLFLSPFAFMIFTSLKTQDQISIVGAPIYPAAPPKFEYNGEQLEIFIVPLPDGTTKELAMFKKGQKESTFIDPANLDAGEILWTGSWRLLDRPWEFSPTYSNYSEAWGAINYPQKLWNTFQYAIVSVIGTLISCTLVAYGFARFRFPGRDLLFIVLISTIFLPAFVTVIPTYTFFVKIGWVGTWLPLIVPHFFANAYNVFLLRQYFLTLPRELDEAAMIDGASPLRVLWSVIIPQSYPVFMAITVFHIVFAWNDYFGPVVYLASAPDKWPISYALSMFNGIYGQRPQLIQAGALMALILPLILFVVAQRFFVQGIVVTGVEK